MRNLKAYQLVWVSAILILLLSALGVNTTFDIKYHDTYFVSNLFHLGILFSLLLAFIGLIYWWILDKPANDRLQITHLGLTIGVMAAMLLTIFVNDKFFRLGFSTSKLINTCFFLVLLVLVVSQLLLVINVIIALMGRKKGLK